MEKKITNSSTYRLFLHLNWQESDQLLVIGSSLNYQDFYLKRHIFLLDYGLQLNWQFKRVNFFINQLWQNAFTPIAEKVGTYTFGGPTYDFTITFKERASVFMLGLQYQFHLRDKDVFERKPRKERVLPVPDSLRTFERFFGRNRFALAIGTPLFVPRNQSQTGEGNFQYLVAPGFMIGADYYWHFNPRLSLRAGVRGGFQHYVYNYRISGEAIGKDQNFIGSNSAGNGFASFPVQLQARKILNQMQYLGFGVGASANFFISDALNYIQPRDVENPDLLINTDYFDAAKPSISPLVAVQYGKLMRNGNLWQVELRYQQGTSEVMKGSYQFINYTNGTVAGEGNFSGGNSYIGLELSYQFNSLRRQIRQNLLKR